MERGDFVLVGCGGGGSAIVDSILNADARFEGFFFNTSHTDMKDLENINKKLRNFYTISTQNGVGRNKKLGRELAEQRSMNMIDILNRFHQDTIYLVSTFSGGSGSAILGVLLDIISEMKSEGVFDKKINVIGVLPSITSSTNLLKNAKDTWRDVMSKDVVNSIIFIDNNNYIEGQESMSELEKEKKINEEFAALFDSIFDIPDDNGKNFDTGNLSNILNDKGCLYIYDIPSDCSSVNVAFNAAKKNSILASMYLTDNNTKTFEDNRKAIYCNHIGISLASKKYSEDFFTKKFINKKEKYVGKNINEQNLLLLSGMFPPVHIIKSIDKELEERIAKGFVDNNSDDLDFSNFIIDSTIIDATTIEETKIEEERPLEAITKKLKKNFFKRRVK